MPLMLEYAVPIETGPYLVSSSSSVLWVSDPHRGPAVKAAVRDVSLGQFFQEVVAAVASMGRQQEWDNVHPLTLEGVQAAIQHVAFYGLAPLELLVPRAYPPTDGEDDGEDSKAPMPQDLKAIIMEVGLPFRPSAWVPPSTMIVVPKDRTYLGTVHLVTPRKLAGVVHNAARGMGVAQG